MLATSREASAAGRLRPNALTAEVGTSRYFSGNATYRALSEMEGKVSRELVQSCVLCLELLEDWDVGVGVFPQRQKILISGL